MPFTKRAAGKRGEGALGAIIGLAILAAVGFALFKIVPLHIAGNDVKDAMSEAANFASIKQDDRLRWDIFQRAQKAGAPLQQTEIRISRPAQAVKISAKYETSVVVLGYTYVYRFDETVEKPTF